MNPLALIREVSQKDAVFQNRDGVAVISFRSIPCERRNCARGHIVFSLVQSSLLASIIGNGGQP
jgi:hypothetical protein